MDKNNELKLPVRKRLNLDIHLALHQKIKVLAIRRNISLRVWVVRALLEAIKKEEKYI